MEVPLKPDAVGAMATPDAVGATATPGAIWATETPDTVTVMPTSAPDPAAAARPLVSAVMPCLNEERPLGVCVDKALRAFRAMGVAGEVVVADNGSTDASVEVARDHGARVVQQPVKGYGAALQ